MEQAHPTAATAMLSLGYLACGGTGSSTRGPVWSPIGAGAHHKQGHVIVISLFVGTRPLLRVEAGRQASVLDGRDSPFDARLKVGRAEELHESGSGEELALGRAQVGEVDRHATRPVRLCELGEDGERAAEEGIREAVGQASARTQSQAEGSHARRVDRLHVAHVHDEDGRLVSPGRFARVSLARPIELEPPQPLLELARVRWEGASGSEERVSAWTRAICDERFAAPKLSESRIRTTSTPGTSSCAPGCSSSGTQSSSTWPRICDERSERSVARHPMRRYKRRDQP
jgi:hypothetical protein